MSDELLPCAHCGGHNLHRAKWEWGHPYIRAWHKIVCKQCQLSSPRFETLDEARQWWNRRTPAIPAGVAATMRAALEGQRTLYTVLGDCGEDANGPFARIEAALAWLDAQEATT